MGEHQEVLMRLSPPKKIVWFLSFILAVLSIASKFVAIEFVSVHAFWFMAAAWFLLFIATVFKGL
jgi:threonine/homoserine/homoserine lactone efflux protein